MKIRDIYLDSEEEDAPASYPAFVHGMLAEDISDRIRDVAVDYEDADGRVFECIVSYDGDTVAWVDGYDERGNRADFTDEQREAIVMLAARRA